MWGPFGAAAFTVLLLLSSCGDQTGAPIAEPSPRETASQSPAASPTAPPTPSATASPTASPSGSASPGTTVDLDEVARRFVLFARGRRTDVPTAALVGIYLGGQPVRTIPGADIDDRAQWEGLCPEDGGSYAGRTCPFSVLAPLRSGTGAVATTDEPASHPCADPTPMGPQFVGGTHRVTLVPDPAGTCVDWVAVELYVNDVAQVVAVNLVWAEP